MPFLCRTRVHYFNKVNTSLQDCLQKLLCKTKVYDFSLKNEMKCAILPFQDMVERKKRDIEKLITHARAGVVFAPFFGLQT